MSYVSEVGEAMPAPASIVGGWCVGCSSKFRAGDEVVGLELVDCTGEPDDAEWYHAACWAAEQEGKGSSSIG